MNKKHTLKELNSMGHEELVTIILIMRGQLDTLNENIEKLIEQVRIANQHCFGRKTETMQSIEGQLSFFDEADALYDKDAEEPGADEALPSPPAVRKPKGREILTLRSFRKISSRPILFPKKRWMLFMGLAAGGVCRTKPIRGCGMNRSHGP